MLTNCETATMCYFIKLKVENKSKQKKTIVIYFLTRLEFKEFINDLNKHCSKKFVSVKNSFYAPLNAVYISSIIMWYKGLSNNCFTLSFFVSLLFTFVFLIHQGWFLQHLRQSTNFRKGSIIVKLRCM